MREPTDPPPVFEQEQQSPSGWGPALEIAESEGGVPFAMLPALRIVNVNSRKSDTIRLYDMRGRLDEDAAAALDVLLADSRDPDNIRMKELDRRVYQMLYRAAYHFHSSLIEVVSAYREPRSRSEGRHGFGRALDFRLNNVSAPWLAAYLRSTMARVGVGFYTHPSTQFVHLDDRDRSYFWVDASPPGRHWRERPIGVVGAAKRDAAYEPRFDWPEGTRPSDIALAMGPTPILQEPTEPAAQ
jgi:uncharacterized protein YcbK (DUF882 family)